MIISKKALNIIKKYEGCYSKDRYRILKLNKNDMLDNVLVYPYYCPAYKKTIGYGCVINHSNFDNGITYQECEELFIEKINYFSNVIRNAVLPKLNQNQFDALVCFVYNIGEYGFAKSKLLTFINRNINNLGKIEKEWKKWIYVKGKKLPGLVTRRNEEFKLFSSKENNAPEYKSSFIKTTVITYIMIRIKEIFIKRSV